MAARSSPQLAGGETLAHARKLSIPTVLTTLRRSALGGAQFPGCLPPPCAKWPCVTWLGGRFLFVLSPFWLGRCRHCLIAFSRLSGLKLHDPAETRAIGLLVSRVLLLRSGAFVFAAFFSLGLPGSAGAVVFGPLGGDAPSGVVVLFFFGRGPPAPKKTKTFR